MIQDKDGVIAAAPSSVPDRHFRNAWMFDSAQTAITEDLTAAKVIFQDKIVNDVFIIRQSYWIEPISSYPRD